MSRCAVIVSGGSIEEAFTTDFIKEKMPQYLIGVDRGLEFLYRSQMIPTHIVGDFDSVDKGVIAYYQENTDIPIRKFNPVKDASDTEIAVRLAIELGAVEIWLLGATGTRLDHVMANIQTLKIAHDAGVQAYIQDTHNRISIISGEKRLKRSQAFGKYFSVFPLGSIVKDFSIKGAKYPLTGHALCPYDSLCVSNQFAAEEVMISFPEGFVILMETRDDKM